MGGSVLRGLLRRGALLTLLVLDAAILSLPAAASLAATDVVGRQFAQLALTLLLRTPTASTVLPAILHSAAPVAQELMQH